MATNGYYYSLQQEEFAVGNFSSTVAPFADVDQTIQVLDRLAGAPLYGIVRCDVRASVPLVFSLEQSNDNGIADAFAAINIRVGGASVANVTVQPGGRVVFTVETQTKDWLKLKATRTSYGTIVVCGFGVRCTRFPFEQ